MLLLALGGQRADAQAGGWAIAQKVPGIDAKIEPPLLVADQNRTVHAFFSLPVEGDVVVAYSRWTLAGGWTQPVDILLPPLNREAHVRGAYLDKAGIMHLIIVGGNQVGAAIYYSRAYASEAARAPAWSKPVLVGPDADPLLDAALSGDDKGNLFVVYSGLRDGYRLEYLTSPDSGNTWSEPETVFLTRTDTQRVFALGSTLDDSGRFHVVWGVFNDKGTGDSIYYARLEANHKRWTQPFALAEHKAYEVNSPAIVSAGNEVTVMYDDSESNVSIVPTRWMRRSVDGGNTWSAPLRPFRQVGANGHPAFSVDGKSNVQLVFGNRIGYPGTHGMWYSQWAGSAWTEPLPIVSGVQSEQFDPNAVQGVVSQGNVLLVVWRMDPALRAPGLWYSYLKLNAPEGPVVPLPHAPATPTPAPAVATPAASPTVAPVKTPATPMPASGAGGLQNNSSAMLLAGLIPAGGLIVLIVASRLFNRR